MDANNPNKRPIMDDKAGDQGDLAKLYDAEINAETLVNEEIKGKAEAMIKSKDGSESTEKANPKPFVSNHRPTLGEVSARERVPLLATKCVLYVIAKDKAEATKAEANAAKAEADIIKAVFDATKAKAAAAKEFTDAAKEYADSEVAEDDDAKAFANAAKAAFDASKEELDAVKAVFDIAKTDDDVAKAEDDVAKAEAKAAKGKADIAKAKTALDMKMFVLEQYLPFRMIPAISGRQANVADTNEKADEEE